MTGSVASYNTVQKVPGKPTVGTLTTVGTTPTLIYQVPGGRKASIQAFSDQNVNLGVNTFMNCRLTIGGNTVNLRKMVALENNLVNENIQGLTMNAGDKIDATGDNAGDNGTINFILSVQENDI